MPCLLGKLKRIVTSKITFKKLSPLLSNRNIHMDTKMRIVKAYVWSVLLYGCECWTINNTLKKKLEAVEMWFIRRTLRVSWKEKKTNDEVLAMANTGRSLYNSIRRRQIKFTGHIYRAQGVEHLAMTGKINGKRSRGRQRTTFVDSLNTWANLEQNTRNQFMRSTCDRLIWKDMTVNACSRHGT